MSDWGATTYGDPCHQCGFQWTMTQDAAVELVVAIPPRFATLLDGVDGSQRHPDLEWPVVAYVCHVADNLRIWAERLAGIGLGASAHVATYDQDLLARARRYELIAPAAALWSLDRAVSDWSEAVLLADRAGITLFHPERGAQAVIDVVRSNAHDALHHGWDIERSIGMAGH
jgi:hypothetical protein